MRYPSLPPFPFLSRTMNIVRERRQKEYDRLSREHYSTIKRKMCMENITMSTAQCGVYVMKVRGCHARRV